MRQASWQGPIRCKELQVRGSRKDRSKLGNGFGKVLFRCATYRVCKEPAMTLEDRQINVVYGEPVGLWVIALKPFWAVLLIDGVAPLPLHVFDF